MGRVKASVKLIKEGNRIMAEQGVTDIGQVREAEVEFLVETGAALICLPPEWIRKLGLRKLGEKPVVTANGRVTRGVYGPVRFEVMGRDGRVDVMEVPLDAPPLLGYIPLELVDLQPNPKAQRLEGDPDHDGDWVIDAL